MGIPIQNAIHQGNYSAVTSNNESDNNYISQSRTVLEPPSFSSLNRLLELEGSSTTNGSRQSIRSDRHRNFFSSSIDIQPEISTRSTNGY